MIIEVTKEDIENGESCNSNMCPLAKAFIRCGCTYASVSYEYLSFSYKTKKYICDNPKELKQFINDVDYNRNPQPFRLEVDLETEEITVLGVDQNAQAVL